MDVEEVPKKKRYKKFDLVVVTEAFGLSRDQLKAGSHVHFYDVYGRLSFICEGFLFLFHYIRILHMGI